MTLIKKLKWIKINHNRNLLTLEKAI